MSQSLSQSLSQAMSSPISDPEARCRHCGCPETLDPDGWKRPLNRMVDWAIVGGGVTIFVVVLGTAFLA